MIGEEVFSLLDLFQFLGVNAPIFNFVEFCHEVVARFPTFVDAMIRKTG